MANLKNMEPGPSYDDGNVYVYDDNTTGDILHIKDGHVIAKIRTKVLQNPGNVQNPAWKIASSATR